MNSKKAKALRRMSSQIALEKKLDVELVYSRLKKVALKNKKLKV